MRVEIKDIAYYLPERVVDNEELHEQNPGWDMNLVEQRSGVLRRCIAGEDETSLDLALKACAKLLSRNTGLREQIDGVIFCTESPDHILPPNSYILHRMLELSKDTLAFDFNLACSGYVYGLILAQGLIISGAVKNVLLVTAETYSKYIHIQDRSSRVLFGDGAAVSWIAASDSSKGITAIKCSTFGASYDKFIIPAGGCRMPKSEETAMPKTNGSGNMRTLENIHMDGMAILTFVNREVPKQVLSLLNSNELSVEDIDLFVFHQASKMVLDSLTRLLRLKREKVYRNISEVGNTVSASIPIALKEALDSGAVPSDGRVLLAGFGVGLSVALAIMET